MRKLVKAIPVSRFVRRDVREDTMKKILLLLVLCSAPLVAQVSLSRQDNDSKIELKERSATERHAITLDDIVSFREAREPRRSPDGSRVAFLVDQGFRDCDCNKTALFVVSRSAGSRPVKLLEEASLSSVGWIPSGSQITYLSAKSGSQQLWKVDPASKATELVFTHTPGEDQSIARLGYHPSDTTAVGVATYEWSPDGKRIAFTSSPPIDKSELERLNKQGVLFDENMDSLAILTNQWIKVPTQLWVYDVAAKSEKQLWQNGVKVYGGQISSVHWSPDSTKLSFAYSAPPKLKESMVFWNQDIGLIDVSTKAFTSVSAEESAEMQPKWSPDGRYLAFCSVLGYTTSPLTILDVAKGTKTNIAGGSNARDFWWSDDSRSVVYQSTLEGKRRSRSGLFRVSLNGEVQRVTPEAEHVEDCDNLRGEQAACVWQTSNDTPKVAVVSLRNGRATPLADVNPEFKSVDSGHVDELRWLNKYGAETTGYLIKPFGYSAGRKYPLLIILYGFEGKFVTQAEWLSSYPAQAFARDGFVVLMTNYPPYESWNGKDFLRGSIAEAYSPLSSIEAAVDRLVKDGLADESRVGIMGISYGGFLTEFSITHSTKFHVSSLVDGGGYGPAAYAMSGHNMNENDERVLGGPPYGKTLENWLSFSPPLNADKVMGPILMGFNNHEAFYGMEMRTALRKAGVPTEFWVYPGEGHIFTGPEHRYLSMERNLDWFNFWLKSQEDLSPVKAEQYRRWREMRKQQKARRELGSADTTGR